MWGLRVQIDDLRKENLVLRLALLRIEGLLKANEFAKAKAEIRKVLTSSS
jgi:hypothetical protein